MQVKIDTHVQDEFLQEAKDRNTPLILYITNGFKIRGTIIDFDEVSILVESDSKKQMVYKHALSTVSPYQESKSNPSTGYRSW